MCGLYAGRLHIPPKHPQSAWRPTQNGLAQLKKLFIWLPSFSSTCFVKSEKTICCPVIMVGQGRWGLQIGKGHRIEGKWQLLSQNLHYLPACLQQACHLNKTLFPDISWLLWACVSVCVLALLCFLCGCVGICVLLSNLDHFQVRIVPEPSWYAVSVMPLTKTLFFPFSLLHDALDQLQMDCFSE